MWRCIEQHVNRRAGPFQARVSAADISRATGISAQVLSKWRHTPTLPDPEMLATVAAGIHAPYRELLEAALQDRGWLPEPRALRRTVDQRLQEGGLNERLDALVAQETDDDASTAGSA